MAGGLSLIPMTEALRDPHIRPSLIYTRFSVSQSLIVSGRPSPACRSSRFTDSQQSPLICFTCLQRLLPQSFLRRVGQHPHRQFPTPSESGTLWLAGGPSSKKDARYPPSRSVNHKLRLQGNGSRGRSMRRGFQIDKPPKPQRYQALELPGSALSRLLCRDPFPPGG